MAPFNRLFRLIGREPGVAEDIAAEFEAHLSLRIDALMREGLSADVARREAERRFGPVQRFAAECRAIDRVERRERRWRDWWGGVGQDLRLAARSLARAPGFTTSAVAALALGIGLNTTVFATLRSVVLRPLPYPHAERLAAVYSSNPKGGWPTFPLSPTDFYDYERDSRTFASMVAWDSYPSTLTGAGPAEQFTVVAATSGLFAVADVAPALGRVFREGEFAKGAAPVCLISDQLWRVRFNADPGILGRSMRLDGSPCELIGVMPPGFSFPVSGASIWLPFQRPDKLEQRRGAHYISAAGRLVDGQSLDAARNELTTLADRIARAYPASSLGWTIAIRSLHDDLVGDVRPTLVLLMTGAGLLLIIACANVANLVLVRAVGRGGELAVRGALGAPRGRLLWHGASEVLVLSLIGAAVAVPIALAGTALVRLYAPEGVPRSSEVRLDAMALVFALGITALTALLVAVVPVRRIGRADLRLSLGGVGGRTVAARRELHRWLVGLETALAITLLSVAGVLLKSKARLESVPPGLDPSSTLVADLSLADARHPTGDAEVAFQRELLRRLEALPGVEAAALTTGLPLSGALWSSSFTIDSVPVPDNVRQSAQLRIVSPGYFKVQRIPLLEGRTLEATDLRGGHRVVLVNAAAVRKYWPDGRPLGHFVRLAASTGSDKAEGVVVGVVGDVREFGFRTEPPPMIYVSSEQMGVGSWTLAVRTRGDPRSIEPGLRRIVTALDPELPITGVRTMDDVVRAATATARFRAWLMGFFAILAVTLAGLGVYGVIAHLVAQRTREIGLRRALGASDHRVVADVVRSAMRDSTLGAAAGLFAGWLIAKRLGTALFQVQPGDPLVLGIATALFLGVALLASWIPARRATSADPVQVLRGE